MNDLKQVKRLTIDDKLMHYRWLVDHITKKNEFPIGQRVKFTSIY